MCDELDSVCPFLNFAAPLNVVRTALLSDVWHSHNTSAACRWIRKELTRRERATTGTNAVARPGSTFDLSCEHPRAALLSNKQVVSEAMVMKEST